MNDFDKIDECLYYEGYKAFELCSFKYEKEPSSGKIDSSSFAKNISLCDNELSSHMNEERASCERESDARNSELEVGGCELYESMEELSFRENEPSAIEQNENSHLFTGVLFDSVDR